MEKCPWILTRPWFVLLLAVTQGQNIYWPDRILAGKGSRNEARSLSAHWLGLMASQTIVLTSSQHHSINITGWRKLLRLLELSTWNLSCYHQKLWLRMLTLTLHNVCPVHRGMWSTLGDIQYTGEYYEYSEGLSSVHWGCPVHWRDNMSTPGDIMINVGEGHWENNWICLETPVYSWYPPLYWTPPSMLTISPGVLNILRYTVYSLLYCTDIMQVDSI